MSTALPFDCRLEILDHRGFRLALTGTEQRCREAAASLKSHGIDSLVLPHLKTEDEDLSQREKAKAVKVLRALADFVEGLQDVSPRRIGASIGYAIELIAIANEGVRENQIRDWLGDRLPDHAKEHFQDLLVKRSLRLPID